MKTSSKGGNAGSSTTSISVKDRKKLQILHEELNLLTEKYQMPVEDLLDFTGEIQIPCSIMSHKLTVLESAVKYLKENKRQTLRQIGDILGRDERNIWHTYKTASGKMQTRFVIGKEELEIPIAELSSRKWSAQECVVVYLKDRMNMRYSEIAAVLNRNDRTVWTAYNRAKKK